MTHLPEQKDPGVYMDHKSIYGLLQALVLENPRRRSENWLDYLDRLAVLAGLLKPGEGRLPADYGFDAAGPGRRSGLDRAAE